MQKPRTTQLLLSILVILPALTVYLHAGCSVERAGADALNVSVEETPALGLAQRAFDDGKYAEAIRILEKTPGGSSRERDFLMAAAQMRLAFVRQGKDYTAIEPAREGLLEICRFADDEFAARAYAELIRAGQMYQDGVQQFQERTLSFWENSTDLVRASEHYAELAHAFVAADCNATPQLERIWNNLSALPADEWVLEALAVDVLRNCGGDWRWGHSYLNGAPGLSDGVARFAVGRDIDPALLVKAHGSLAAAAEQDARFVVAVEHFQQALELAKDKNLRSQLQSRLDAILNASATLSVSERLRPGVNAAIRIHWRNISEWEFRILELDFERDRNSDYQRKHGDRLILLFNERSGRELHKTVMPDRAEQFARTTTAASEARHKPREKDLPIEGLAPGLYVFEMAGKPFEGKEVRQRELVAVSELGVVALNANLNSHNALWVVNSKTGKPITNAEAELIINVGGANNDEPPAKNLEVTTDDAGLLTLNYESSRWSEVVLLGMVGDQPLLSTSRFYTGARPSRDEMFSGFIWSDRPLYRPGENVNLQAFVRRLNAIEHEFEVFQAQDVTLVVRTPAGEELLKRDFRLDDNGSFDTNILLGDVVPLGSYSVAVSRGKKLLASGSFSVDEFRVPEFTVAAAVVEGATPVLGDTLQVQVQAEYLFGGPVRGEANIVVTRRPVWSIWRPRHRLPWLHEQERIIPPNYYGGGEIVLNVTVGLDDDGRTIVQIPTSAQDNYSEFMYDIQALVTDSSRRQEAGRSSVRIGRSEYLAFMHSDRNFLRKSERASLTLRIQDQLERGLAREGRWWVERVDLNGSAVVQKSSAVVTDASGEANLNLRLTETGLYAVKFEGVDQRGRTVSAETALRVLNSNDSQIPVVQKGLQLIVQSDEFLGDRAQVLLLSDVAGLPVLLSQANGLEISHRMVQMNGTAKIIEFKLDKKHRPSFEIAAMGMHEFEFRQARTTVVAPDPTKLLDIQMEFDAAEYLPGEQAELRFRVKDLNGDPVSTILSLAVVDESVLALMPRPALQLEERFTDLPRLRLPSASVATPYPNPLPEKRQQAYALGAELLEDADELHVRGGRSKGALARMDIAAPTAQPMAEEKEASTPQMQSGSVRTDFRLTAIWKTGIRTDAQGRAALDVPLAESLTKWKATAVGFDPRTRVGEGEATARTRKNLMVRFQHPRVFRENDKFVVNAVVHNETDSSIAARVLLRHDLKIAIAKAQNVDVPAHGSARVQWKLDLTDIDLQPEVIRDDLGRIRRILPATATLTVEAATTEAHDALERRIRLEPFGSPVHLAHMQQLEPGKQSLNLDLPGNRLRGTETVTLTVTPTLLATCVQALPYLADYPYGCAEQTLSRFVPAVSVAAAARAMGLNAEDLDPELDDKIAAGLDRVLSMQHESGGWGWWKTSKTNPYITAHALLALTRARDAGVEFDEDVLRHAIQDLSSTLGALTGRPDDQAYAFLAITLAAKSLGIEGDSTPIRARAQQLFSERDRLSAYTRALLVRVLHSQGDEREARLLLEHLENDVEIDSKISTAHWGRQRGYYWRRQGAVETTAFVLQAMVDVDPDNELRDDVARWLAFNRRGHRWDSTRSTAHAIYALCDHLDEQGVFADDFDLRIRSDGKELLHLDAESVGVGGGRYELPASVLGTNTAKLDVVLSGDLHPMVTLEVDAFSQANKIEAAGQIIEVAREVVRLRSVRTLGKGFVIQEEPVGDGTTIRSGDRLKVRIKLLVHHDVDFVIIEDPRPAGTEPLQRLSGPFHSGSLFGHRSVHDGHTAFFVDTLAEGEHTLEYELVAESPGEFHIAPARALAMYLPDVVGNSASAELDILAEK